MKDYKKLKETYLQYLASYKKMNSGSLAGASSWPEFYRRQTYHSIYNDKRIIALMGSTK